MAIAVPPVDAFMSQQPTASRAGDASDTLAALFPASVAVAASTEPTLLPLYPEEEASLGRSVERRRADFTTGRACARRALSQLGFAPAPIGRGPAREPLWPAGVCGSITHCDGYWAAAVARHQDILSLGLDAEVRRSVRPEVFARITVDLEREWLRVAEPGLPWDVLFFSAKESVYKAWLPLTRRWLGFQDVRITFEVAARTFHADLLSEPEAGAFGARRLFGRFHADADRILTTVVVPAVPDTRT